jgi:hypothetical protein
MDIPQQEQSRIMKGIAKSGPLLELLIELLKLSRYFRTQVPQRVIEDPDLFLSVAGRLCVLQLLYGDAKKHPPYLHHSFLEVSVNTGVFTLKWLQLDETDYQVQYIPSAEGAAESELDYVLAAGISWKTFDI